jgi:hypothetical protein
MFRLFETAGVPLKSVPQVKRSGEITISHFIDHKSVKEYSPACPGKKVERQWNLRTSRRRV